MDQEQLAEIVKEIEDEKALDRVSAVQVFKSILNQPELICFSSANATANGSSYAYSQFSVNMPRSVLEVDTLQLLTANIPLCTQNIPDTACTFWYYRLDDYANPVPNTENLFFVRLLPSYYKPEFFQPTTTTYGVNVTFDNYPAVATQLALSCVNDLAYDNLALTSGEWSATTQYQLQYVPNDITITYDTTQNKFQMTGLNTAAPLFAASLTNTYAAGTTYDAGVFVTDALNLTVDAVWRSLKNGNIGNTPRSNPTWWTLVTTRLVEDFVAYTPYRKGQYVSYPLGSGTIYQASVNIYSSGFNISDGWVTPPPQDNGPFYYRYLVTGYNDPNVVTNQRGTTGVTTVGTAPNQYQIGTSPKRQWNQYALYDKYNSSVPTGDIVQYEGATYTANYQNKGMVPFYVPNTTTNAYSTIVQYNVGDYAYYSGRWFICILQTIAHAPPASYSNNTWWAFIEYDTTKTTYKAGDLVTYIGYAAIPFWKCILDNPPANSITGTAVVFSSQYWIPSYWTPSTSTMLPISGLNYISSQFDMIDNFPASSPVWQYPFPFGIPGQPFNPNPRRLLNSILGFCWNGIFNPTVVNAALTSTNIIFSSSTTETLNRIRPVPYYYKRSGGGGLESGQPTTATVYTADGYANLVYTSVVYIYSTIVYGSTINTDRNTNLIGLASMNAGNLGVSFFANFIDGKLKVNEADIYSIGVELRDEMGELYPVTNNGITTFTLKLTYKDKVETKDAQ